MKKHILFLALLVAMLSNGFANNSKVLILKIMDNIDPRMWHYVDLGFKKAEADSISTVILHMDTYGGAVADAENIVKRIQRFNGTTIVYIDSKAASAGSFISVACDSIFMSKDATIGASTVVDQNGTVLPEKIQSHMRSRFKAVAESHGGDTLVVDGDTLFKYHRDPGIAQGFVGFGLQTDSAKVFSFSAGEAIQKGFCEGIVSDIDGLVGRLGFSENDVVEYELDPENSVIAFFINPVVKSILIMMILGGVYMEMKTPGFGIPISVALLGVVGYFVPDYLHGLLEAWELLIFIIGLILIAVEIFVIPGFGFVGITGIVFMMTGFMFSMIGNVGFDFRPVSKGALQSAFGVISVSIFAGSIFLVLLGMILIKSNRFKSFTVQGSIDKNAAGIDKADKYSLDGKEGEAVTDLRPSGRIRIGDELYDAITQGGFISKGESIRVLERKGISLLVKKNS